MRRVYGLYLLRVALSPQTVAILGLVVSLALVYLSVSIQNVLSNMPTPVAFTEFVSFWQSAIIETERMVQFALLCAIAFGVVTISRLAKILRTREVTFQ